MKHVLNHTEDNPYIENGIKRVATMVSVGLNRAEIADNVAPDKMSDPRVRHIVVAGELLAKWREELVSGR